MHEEVLSQLYEININISHLEQMIEQSYQEIEQFSDELLSLFREFNENWAFVEGIRVNQFTRNNDLLAGIANTLIALTFSIYALTGVIIGLLIFLLVGVTWK